MVLVEDPLLAVSKASNELRRPPATPVVPNPVKVAAPVAPET
jgi:hypothetical protein